MATKKKKTSSTMSDWSQLPEELLHIISKNLEDHCFDVIHARSVCSYWRSSFPFPSCLSRQTYTLPSLPFENEEGLCTLEKFPMLIFKVRSIVDVSPSEFYLGRIYQDDQMDMLPSPLQCSVKVKIPGTEPNLINMLDCQILPLGHQYKMTDWDHRDNRSVTFLPLNKDGGGEFVVVYNYMFGLLVLTSAEMKWKRLLENVRHDLCLSLVAFNDRFYAAFLYGGIFVINPYTLVVTPLRLSPLMWNPLLLSSPRVNILVPSGNNELFCVSEAHYDQFCVSRLDEKDGKWVNVNNLRDRVLFIGQRACFSYLAFSCSAKELPDSCGLSGNSIFWLSEYNIFPGYKTRITAEDLDNYYWTFSVENRMRILNSSSFLAFRVLC